MKDQIPQIYPLRKQILTKSDGWSNAMEDMDYVIHTASPLGGNNHENPELIPIAKKGVENVLSSAMEEGVEKIVMTSSEAACYPDKSNADPKINESYWTDFNNKDITNYQRSKLIAENCMGYNWKTISI